MVRALQRFRGMTSHAQIAKNFSILCLVVFANPLMVSCNGHSMDGPIRETKEVAVWSTGDSLDRVIPEARSVSTSSCPKPVDDLQSVTNAFVSILYPSAEEDAGIACLFDSPDCQDYTTHLSPVHSGTMVPSVQDCRSGRVGIQHCYESAVRIVREGLDTGSAAHLYAGAIRTRDAILRALVADVSVPEWLRSFGPQNLLANYFHAGGISLLEPLPDCVTGSLDARYLCLSDIKRSTYRALLGLLDHHVGVQARHGELQGASERAWAVVESATAPVHVRMVERGQFAAREGVRMNRIDLLGKYSVLRALDGSAQPSEQTELAHLVTRNTYLPQQASADVAAVLLPRFDVLATSSASLLWIPKPMCRWN